MTNRTSFRLWRYFGVRTFVLISLWWFVHERWVPFFGGSGNPLALLDLPQQSPGPIESLPVIGYSSTFLKRLMISLLLWANIQHYFFQNIFRSLKNSRSKPKLRVLITTSPLLTANYQVIGHCWGSGQSTYISKACAITNRIFKAWQVKFLYSKRISASL